MSQPSVNAMLESESYQMAKEVLFREINRRQVPYKTGSATIVAPTSSMPYYNRVESVDYSVFKNLPGEKQAKKSLRKQFKHPQKWVLIAHVRN